MNTQTLDGSVRTMPAGRALDVLVAQHVMGWVVSSNGDDIGSGEELEKTVFYIGEFSDGEFGEALDRRSREG